MPSSKEYRDFVLEQLSLLGDVSVRPMMGEFLLYYAGTLFGGVYDDCLLVKKTEQNSKYTMREAVPYPGAKPMYLVEDMEDKEKLKNIVLDTCKGLKIKNKGRKK